MGLKKLFGSKESKTPNDTDKDKDSPFSKPRLTPGVYGRFPPTFNIYYAAPAKDKKVNFYCIAQSADSPLYAVTVHQGMVKHQLTLHAGPRIDSPALALAGVEKLFRSTAIIALPANSSSGENRIVQMKLDGGIKIDRHSFSVPVGPADDVETFEWRSGDKVKTAKAGEPLQYQLLRLKGGSEEIVGVWTEEKTPGPECKLGGFQWQGSGSTGQLGEYWTLLAVTSLIRIMQVQWELNVATDKMIGGAARVASLGMGLAL